MVVKASIAGSIIGNILVVLGAALLLGGLKNGEQRFDARIASTNATIMSLAIIVLMIPAVFALGADGSHLSSDDIINLSDGAAIILIVLYALYLIYTIFSQIEASQNGRHRGGCSAQAGPASAVHRARRSLSGRRLRS